MNKIEITKALPSEHWEKFFDSFTESNLGRHFSIEIIDAELGDEELIQNAPLLAMIYDRPNKGDNLAIEMGKDEMSYGHSVYTPTEILTGENDKGEIIAIWISDAAGRKTLVKAA